MPTASEVVSRKSCGNCRLQRHRFAWVHKFGVASDRGQGLCLDIGVQASLERGADTTQRNYTNARTTNNGTATGTSHITGVQSSPRERRRSAGSRFHCHQSAERYKATEPAGAACLICSTGTQEACKGSRTHHLTQHTASRAADRRHTTDSTKVQSSPAQMVGWDRADVLRHVVEVARCRSPAATCSACAVEPVLNKSRSHRICDFSG